MKVELNPSMLLVVGVLLCGGVLTANARSRQREGGDSSETWGGHGVTMRMTAQGATLEFDCARGIISQPIKPDAKGEFTASGTYTAERGGPVSRNNQPNEIPAVYRGAINGDTMRLEIVVNEKDQSPALLTLTRGNAGRLVKCR